MKPIEARDQAGLSWARCLRLAVSGMSYRMLRSGITTAILALAVAFLVYVVAYAILSERAQRTAWEQLEPTRAAVRDLTRLTTPDTPEVIRQRLAGGDPLQKAEYRAWYAGEDDAWGQAVEGAEALAQTQRWFDQLGPSESAVLLGGEDLPRFLDRLQTEDGRSEHRERLDQFQLGLDWITHRSNAGDLTITRWPVLQQVAQTIRAGHAASVEAWRVRDTAGPGQSLILKLPSPELREQLAEAGFQISETRVERLRGYAADRQQLTAVALALEDPEVRAAAALRLDSPTPEVLVAAVRDAETLSWWEGLTGTTVDTDFAERFTRDQRLMRLVEGYAPADSALPFGLSWGTLWLVALSLLVCVVGVSNALLMSVTERFSEIATMKCLGAMDGSVMRVFVIEALIQGVVGGTLGVLLGLLLAVGRGFLEFGGLFTYAAGGTVDVLLAAALSLGVGVLLATVAAVGPSWVASRLAPMEAMRVE